MSLKNDYNDFISSKQSLPSKEIDFDILKRVKNDLCPSAKIVFSKLLGIQLGIGTLTLLFCPQFGLSLTNHYELFHYFHRTFGSLICNAVCGLIFIGLGSLLAVGLFKKSEIQLVFRSLILYSVLVTAIIISFFILFGAQVYFEAAIIWSLSVIVCQIVILTLGKLVKSRFQFD